MLTVDFRSGFFTGSASTTDVRWDVALGGHGYMVDTKFIDQFGRQTVPMIRQQADTSDRPAEASLNPEGLWRRAMESWHLGAGQQWLDRPDSMVGRFYQSKGVDPWTKYALTLLPDTETAVAATGSNLYLTTAGGRLYTSDGQTIRATGVGTEVFADCTGSPAADCTGLASDGTTCYAAFGTSGVYTTTGTALSSVYTGTAGIVRYLLGRLIISSGAAIYNVTSTGAISDGTELLDHPNSDWAWTDAGEGPGHIYLSGFAGDKSLIYRTAIKDDGSGLDVAVVAASLPDGEIARSVTGYLGFVVIGTDLGVRFAVPDSNGNLTLGALIETTSPVLCAEGQGRFVWYGLTNPDEDSTGLGRLDLKSFTEDLTPAYASDLMAAGQGDVQAVVTYLGKRWFTASEVGVFKESDAPVTSGWVRSGVIAYGLPDTKTLIALDVRHDPLPADAEVTLAYSRDVGAFTVAGSSETDGTSVSPPDAFVVNQARGAAFEIKATITGPATLRRVTLYADPAATRTVTITVPLLLFADVNLPGYGTPQQVDVAAEYTFLDALCRDRRVINYQEAGRTTQVVLDDYRWLPHKRRDTFWDGTFLAQLKEI